MASKNMLKQVTRAIAQLDTGRSLRVNNNAKVCSESRANWSTFYLIAFVDERRAEFADTPEEAARIALGVER